MRDLQRQYRDIAPNAREIWPIQAILQQAILTANRLLATEVRNKYVTVQQCLAIPDYDTPRPFSPQQFLLTQIFSPRLAQFEDLAAGGNTATSLQMMGVKA